MSKGGRPPGFTWTTERDQVLRDRYDGKIRGRVVEVAHQLGTSEEIVKRRAAALGLCRWVSEDAAWSSADVAILETWLGRRPVPWIHRRYFANRTLNAVVCKVARLHLSRRVDPGGLTMSELCECMGHGAPIIKRWVASGRLKAKRIGEEHERSYVFTPAQVLDFLRSHPTAYRLDKVDQLWFLDLVFNGAKPKRDRLAAEERKAA
jgi:hypothetical protein